MEKIDLQQQLSLHQHGKQYMISWNLMDYGGFVHVMGIEDVTLLQHLHHFGDTIHVAGHTQFIHAIHGGLVVKHPGHDADWEDGDGVSVLCIQI